MPLTLCEKLLQMILTEGRLEQSKVSEDTIMFIREAISKLQFLMGDR